MRIGIDPGHGGFDPGAIGEAGIKEKDVALAVGIELGRLVQAAGLDMIHTRTTDVAVSGSADQFTELRARTDKLNRSGVDYAISLHCNASKYRTANYFAVYVVGLGGEAEQLALHIVAAIKQVTGWNWGADDNGVREGNLALVRDTAMPAILVEMGFISNPEQEVLLAQADFQRKLAQAIAVGLFNYLGIQQPQSKKANSCTIDIKGLKFPGCLEGGQAYFDGAGVTDVIDALSNKYTWDEKTVTVKVR